MFVHSLLFLIKIIMDKKTLENKSSVKMIKGSMPRQEVAEKKRQEKKDKQDKIDLETKTKRLTSERDAKIKKQCLFIATDKYPCLAEGTELTITDKASIKILLEKGCIEYVKK